MNVILFVAMLAFTAQSSSQSADRGKDFDSFVLSTVGGCGNYVEAESSSSSSSQSASDDNEGSMWGEHLNCADRTIYRNVLKPMDTGMAANELIIANLCYLMNFPYLPDQHLEKIAQNFYNCYPQDTLQIWNKCQHEHLGGYLNTSSVIREALCSAYPQDNVHLPKYNNCLITTYNMTETLAKMTLDVQGSLICQGESVYLIKKNQD